MMLRRIAKASVANRKVTDIPFLKDFVTAPRKKRVVPTVISDTPTYHI